MRVAQVVIRALGAMRCPGCGAIIPNGLATFCPRTADNRAIHSTCVADYAAYVAQQAEERASLEEIACPKCAVVVGCPCLVADELAQLEQSGISTLVTSGFVTRGGVVYHVEREIAGCQAKGLIP